MTEQERLDAIDAFTRLLYDTMQAKASKSWHCLSNDDIVMMRYSTVNMMRSAHEEGLLKGRWLYEYAIQGDWEEASEDVRKICINASITMHEIISAEAVNFDD